MLPNSNIWYLSQDLGCPCSTSWGLLTRAVPAVVAAVVVTTSEPAISLELGVSVTGASAKFTGGVTFVTHVMGGGDHNLVQLEYVLMT